MDINVPKIDIIIPIIVSLASPDQIILFGSCARGENTEKSDIDLLILKKGLTNRHDLIGSIYRAFLDNDIGIAVDLLALDYDRYLKINNDIGYVYRTIKKEGKVVYDAL